MSHIVRDQPGSVVLSPSDSRILYNELDIKNLRLRYRIGNPRVYEILTDITRSAFTANADGGILTRQPAAFEDHEVWTVERLAKASRLGVRTVRLACQRGTLPAVKQGTAWIITPTDARTYIEGHRRN